LPKYAVVDIFAGPGGLAEGFSSVIDADGSRAYSIVLSIEKEPTAHSTLRLRSFLRQFETFPDQYYDFLNEGGAEPDWEALFPEQWQQAKAESWQMELGLEDPGLRLDSRLDEIRRASDGNVILIGGPPCQAYSLVGRSRNQGKDGYIAAKDGRHFLYEEYIRILDRLRPLAFVMENVKGLLSSSIDGESRIVDRVLDDLRGERAGGERYQLLALSPKGRRQLDLGTDVPRAPDFVIRAEDLGIPQARHRVIIVGIREDLATRLPGSALTGLLETAGDRATVEHVLGELCPLRSGLSKGDSPEAWRRAVLDAMAKVAELDSGLPDAEQLEFTITAARYKSQFERADDLPPRAGAGYGISAACPSGLRAWLADERLTRLPNHDSRGHMAADLARYFYAAVFAKVAGRSPKAKDFPPELAPAHVNWSTGKFADRFRVQVSTGQSTTVTCHISKDGHYFIHPDPAQCRSLTVREAARLQTFPDNYFFRGGRTEQYVQVGNAVPPLLARSIGEALWSVLSREELGGEGQSGLGMGLPRVA
jgi:DNA (cytosine-5)-methyltransferase 1